MGAISKAKKMLFLVACLGITLLASAIASFLQALGKIPILGVLFKILAMPFALVAKLKIVFIIIIAAILIIKLVVPILKSIFNKFKNRKRAKVQAVADATLLEDTPVARPLHPTMAQIPSTPVRMDVWEDK